MSKGLTREHIEAFKARLEESRSKSPSDSGGGELALPPMQDLGRVGIDYWRARALAAEREAADARAQLDGVMKTLRTLGLDGCISASES